MNRESSSLSPPILAGKIVSKQKVLREWLSGRASPCQGESRGFDPRLPLHAVKARVGLKRSSLTGRRPCDPHKRDHKVIGV